MYSKETIFKNTISKKKKKHFVLIFSIFLIFLSNMVMIAGNNNQNYEDFLADPILDDEMDFVENNELMTNWNAPEEKFMKAYCGSDYDNNYNLESNNFYPEASYDEPMEIPEIIHVLAILVEFSDTVHTKTKAQINEMVFGSSNSLNAYYNEVTYGKTTIVGNCTDWLVLPEVESYYGEDGTGTDNYYQSRYQTIIDIIDLADPYVNYNLYDKIVIVHAGDEQGSTGVSSDIWTCAYRPIYGTLLTRDTASITTMSINSEMVGIGVWCHAFGSQINLPKLYDFTSSQYYVSHWGLMGKGSWNGETGTSPAHLMGWSKDYLGVIPDEKIKIIPANSRGVVTLDDIETGGDNYLLIKIPLEDDDNYYLIEARFQTGFDTELPDEGVIISKINNTRNSGYGIVEIMDSTQGTITKDDGAFDHSSETEEGFFIDEEHGLQIFIANKTDNTYEIFVRRDSSFTYTEYDLPTQTTSSYNLGTIYVGQEIFWDWNVLSGNEDIDFWIERDDSFVYQLEYDVDHDSGCFKVPITGDYELMFRNENAIYDSTIELEERINHQIDLQTNTFVQNPSSILKNEPFNIQIQITNEGASTENLISITANLPSELSFVDEETATKYCSDLILDEGFLSNWEIFATESGGPFMIDFEVEGLYTGINHFYENVNITVDTVAPALNIEGPMDLEILNQSIVNVIWDSEDLETGLKQFNVYLDDICIDTITDIEEMNYTITNLDSDYHTITIEAEDNDGNKINQTNAILVDLDNPIISNFEVDCDWVPSNTLINCNATVSDDLSGIVASILYLKDYQNEWRIIDQKGAVSGQIELSSFEYSLIGEEVLLKLVVLDAAGNIQESEELSIRVDKNAPTISNFEADLEWISKNTYVHCYASIYDMQSGIVSTKLYVMDYREEWILLDEEGAVSGLVHLVGFESYLIGTEILLKLEVVDAVGNIQESEIVPISVDIENPTISELVFDSEAADSEEYLSGQVLIQIKTSDLNSGVTSVTVRFEINGETFENVAVKNGEYYEYGFNSTAYLETGTIDVYVVVEDLTGNSIETHQVIKIDNSEHFEFIKIVPFLVTGALVLIAAGASLLIVKMRNNEEAIERKFEEEKWKLQLKYTEVGEDSNRSIESLPKINSYSSFNESQFDREYGMEEENNIGYISMLTPATKFTFPNKKVDFLEENSISDKVRIRFFHSAPNNAKNQINKEEENGAN